MISSILSRLIILLFGTLYPAYASYKAVRTKNVKEYVKWMMYWIVFALFTCAETFTDVFFSFWFPFYYEIKVILVFWLLSPATKGSSILYRKFVHPMLTKREQEIDEYLARAKEQGYHTVLSLGSKGVNYATSVIMQTAIKGGGGLVNQLRRSYSLSDISNDMDVIDIGRINNVHPDDQTDINNGSIMETRQLRQRGYNSRSPGGGKVEMYFSEVDVDVDVRSRSSRSREPSIPLSQIRSSEDVSSGYSSADPLYASQPKTDESCEPLLRTSSVGSTRVTRTKTTRASTASKRPQADEGSVPSDESEESDSLNQEEDFYDVDTTVTNEPTSSSIPAIELPVLSTPATSAENVKHPNENIPLIVNAEVNVVCEPYQENEITPLPAIPLMPLSVEIIEVDETKQDDVPVVRMPLEPLLNEISVIETGKTDFIIDDQDEVISVKKENTFISLQLEKEASGNQENIIVSATNEQLAEEKSAPHDSVSTTDVTIPTEEVNSTSNVETPQELVTDVVSKIRPQPAVQAEDNPKDAGKIDRARKYKKRPAPCPPKHFEETEMNLTSDVPSLKSDTSSQESPPLRRELPILLESSFPVKETGADSIKNENMALPNIPPSPKPADKSSKDSSPKPAEKKVKSKDSSISRILSSFPFWHHDNPRNLVSTSLTSLNHLEDLRAMSSAMSSNSLQPPRKKSQEESEIANMASAKDARFRVREMSHSPPRRLK